jgi:dTDP-4-amino-4,6-dideoxygalactose transaminase
MDFLLEHGVQTQVNYMPIRMPPYSQNYLSDIPYLPEAEQSYQEYLSLPLLLSMKDTDPEIVLRLFEIAISNSNYSKQ